MPVPQLRQPQSLPLVRLTTLPRWRQPSWAVSPSSCLAASPACPPGSIVQGSRAQEPGRSSVNWLATRSVAPWSHASLAKCGSQRDFIYLLPGSDPACRWEERSCAQGRLIMGRRGATCTTHRTPPSGTTASASTSWARGTTAIPCRSGRWGATRTRAGA